MAEDPALVVLAAYQDLDAAKRDFDALTAQVAAKQFAMRGAVLVSKDADGNANLVDTGNHLGRRGASWGAGVGLAVGLFAPTLLAAVAVGTAAGAVAGKFADHRLKSGLEDKIGQALAAGIAELGSEHTAPHFAAAWAHANNAPFQWGKQMASHLGGTRNPMVISWPARIKSDPTPRTQFTHCIDVAPTMLEVIGLPVPRSVDGIEQESMDGTSFAHTFDDPRAEERHTVQYFEMFGSRAIYKDGWWACARLDKAPWDFSPQTIARFAPGVYDPDKDVWELYYLPDDFSQARDLAADNPDKLAELKELFWSEAERNRVLPLLGGMSVFFGRTKTRRPTRSPERSSRSCSILHRSIMKRRKPSMSTRLSRPSGRAPRAEVCGGGKECGCWTEGGMRVPAARRCCCSARA